ncbi:MAG: EFR1 family ferrodoxin [Clostridiales bacterium]|nr:EFR1 family ferrodoxin [Clostridiales bacterium]
MIVYYTGTGNSRYCAQFLGRELDDEVIHAFDFIRDGAEAELFSEKPWIFVSPVYAWRLPRIVVEFLRRGHFSGSRQVYFVINCGSDIGNAGKQIRSLCREKSFDYKGTFPIVMPENYIVMYDAPREEEARKIIRDAAGPLKQCAEYIIQGVDFPEIKAGAVDRLKSGIVNDAFYFFYAKAGKFHVSDACVGCGKCQRNCVLNNIQIHNGKPVWGGHCTHCMACICGCPAKAIEYGKNSVGKVRYQCPD